jgi:CubicO group peptidase (beta-lactamase class C family)
LRFLFEPGTEWNYSNIGIDILGRVIELVSKQGFNEFLSERIFRPLGMKDTDFFVPKDKLNRMATLYTIDDGKLKAVSAQLGRAGTSKNSESGGRAGEHGRGPVPFQRDDASERHFRRTSDFVRSGRRADDDFAYRRHEGRLGPPGWDTDSATKWCATWRACFATAPLARFVKGGAYRTYEWVDKQKDMTGIFLMQRNNGGSDTADEINSVMQISAAAVEGK